MNILLFSLVLYIMLQLKLCQKSTKNCHEQHKKFPEIFFPAFGVVGVVMDFHR
jgi:hypothetical protein